ncbi:uncharacterized protein LOC143000388 [Genypterus blacodes]|uniref:uncharacterized protein LOC143000388 n=1 Tax=Genypterus blacodes TaxID=154954 RepID=UPI003F7745F1
MEMLKIEQVIVGSEMMSSAEIKPEPVPAPLQPYQHESLQCFLCFITFCDSKAKERHMRKSHRDLYKQQLQHTNTVFTCYKCDRCFSSSDELTKHQPTHSREEKPFSCTYCCGKFGTFSELTAHRRHDCTQRQCICRYCGEIFNTPARLRSHRNSAHPQRPDAADDNKTYRCGKCSAGFDTEEELMHHQELFADDQNCAVVPPARKRGRPRKHMLDTEMSDTQDDAEEGQEPQPELKIPCPEADCDLTFPSVAALRAHKKECHGQPPRKAHPCTDCDESYARPEQLKTHTARAHSSNRHNCPTCGKSFGRESNLKAHQKTHTEEEEAVGKDIR